MKSIIKKHFNELVKQTENNSSLQSKNLTSSLLDNISVKQSGLTERQIQENIKIGAELTISKNAKTEIAKSGLFLKDSFNTTFNNNSTSLLSTDFKGSKGWKLSYLKNMQLLYEYDLIFRDYLQCIARYDTESLKLFAEERLVDYLDINLNKIRKEGYILEVDSMRIKHNYEVLDFNIYKNLSINRYKNNTRDLKMINLLGMKVAKDTQDTNFLVDNSRPFIFSTTMKVTTPMKLAVMNQNNTQKVYGEETNKDIDYIVRFEAEFDLNDFGWVLPTVNKPNRTRQIRITDFNNVLRGNPYFTDRFDLVGKKRSLYMGEDVEADNKVKDVLDELNQRKLEASMI